MTLGRSQIAVLGVLEIPGTGPLTAREIADRLRLRASHVHTTLGRLINAGLVTRQDGPPYRFALAPQRRYTLTLNAEADTVEDLAAVLQKMAAAALSDSPPDQTLTEDTPAARYRGQITDRHHHG